MLKRKREGQLSVLDSVDRLSLERRPGGSPERTPLRLGYIGRVMR